MVCGAKYAYMLYEAWCTQEDIEEALEKVGKLVKELERKFQT